MYSVTPEPSTLPALNFGGSGPRLHFAHANGYPPLTYTPLIETLRPHYHVTAMLARPLWPGEDPGAHQDWSVFVQDLTQFLDGQGARGLYGVGHSLGALTTLMVACQRPDFFRAIVLIDPGLLSPAHSFVWRWIKHFGLVNQFHPYAGFTLKRRRLFPSVEAMYAHFRPKPLFARVDDRGVRAFVEAAARPRPDGQVELAFPPEWEMWIYETMPHDLWPKLRRLQVPLLLIYGEHSDTFLPGSARALRRALPQAELHGLRGAGHLVPLEKPGAVGELIHAFFQKQSG